MLTPADRRTLALGLEEETATGVSKGYHAALIEALRDPEEAAAYLRAALEEENMAIWVLALRNVIEAREKSAHASNDTLG